MDHKLFIDTEFGNDEYDGASWANARRTVPVEAVQVLEDFDTLTIEVVGKEPLVMPRHHVPERAQININEHPRDE